MTTPATDQPAATTCCGDNGAWGPEKGEALTDACRLCPGAAEKYWRNSRGVRERQAAADQS